MDSRSPHAPSVSPASASLKPAISDHFEADAVEAIRAAGLRVTPPRLAVIRVLARARTAMSAGEIHAAVNRGSRPIDPSSVYRVLATLRRLGLVVNLGSVDGYFPSRLATSEDAIPTMLVNQETHVVEEIDAGPVVADGLRETIRDHGYEPGEIRIEATVTPDEETKITLAPRTEAPSRRPATSRRKR